VSHDQVSDAGPNAKYLKYLNRQMHRFIGVQCLLIFDESLPLSMFFLFNENLSHHNFFALRFA